MGGTNTQNIIKIGIANHSPLDFDSYVDKELKRTTDPLDQDADVLYTKNPTDSKIRIQVVFNDFEFLDSWGLNIGDMDKGKKVHLNNNLTDKLIKGGQ